MTAQISETLIYKGEKLSLCTEPLGYYFKQNQSEIKFVSTSTALWRGYVGTWTIEDGRLYLVKFKGFLEDKNDQVEEVGLEFIFPDYPDGVFAHWYTGELRCPKGEQLNYVHMGYASTYEEDLFIEVDKGVVIGERIARNGNGTGKGRKGYNIGAMTTFGRN